MADLIWGHSFFDGASHMAVHGAFGADRSSCGQLHEM